MARASVRLYEVPVRYFGRTYSQGKKIRARDGVATLRNFVEVCRELRAEPRNVTHALHQRDTIPFCKIQSGHLTPTGLVGMGIPIGNLTSQLFANVYLNAPILGTQYSFDYSERSEVEGLPILPSIGLRGEL